MSQLSPAELTQHELELERTYTLGWSDRDTGHLGRGTDEIQQIVKTKATLVAAIGKRKRLERELEQEIADEERILAEGYGGTD